MRIVCDIECEKLETPEHIWVVVARNIDNGTVDIFRELTEDASERQRFIDYWTDVSLVVGHNWLGYDWPGLRRLLGIPFKPCIDTLVISKLINYSRKEGHSLEDYGIEYNIPKSKFSNYSSYSKELEDRCIIDTQINLYVYNKYKKYIEDPLWAPSIKTEQEFQLIVNDLHDNGFAFNTDKAKKLLEGVTQSLLSLDKEISDAFPERLRLIREITPKVTKHGTLSRSDFRWVDGGDLSIYNGGPFSRCEWVPFNPSSHKQIIEVLNNAGWSPINKTKTHLDLEREVNRLKYVSQRDKQFDLRLKELYTKLEDVRVTGWKIDEDNLNTLPPSAPAPARLLAQRILLEARRRTLTEWLSLVWHEIEIEKTQLGTSGIVINGLLTQSGKNVSEKRTDVGEQIILRNQERVIENPTSNIVTDYQSKTLLEWLKSKKVNVLFVKESASSLLITVIGQEELENFCAVLATVASDGMRNIPIKYKVISQRIHGKFFGIGAWSARMAHQNPNTANIPNQFDTAGKEKLLGKDMRSLWIAPRNRLLVGVDAEGIQLRIFAHYINDPEFTQSLVEGKKDDKTDPHSLNQRILGDCCKSRAAAKRFIYALLLGAGLGKLSEILGTSNAETQKALDRLLLRYTGFATLKQMVIPKDAEKGWFLGLDGRKVKIPGETEGTRKHLCMSGYLQSGEAIAMKLSTLKFYSEVQKIGGKLVNFVHDEWQVECKNNMAVAIEIARLMADSLRQVGEDLKLNCPLAGSYWNDDHHDYTIGTNWSVTH